MLTLALISKAISYDLLWGTPPFLVLFTNTLDQGEISAPTTFSHKILADFPVANEPIKRCFPIPPHLSLWQILLDQAIFLSLDFPPDQLQPSGYKIYEGAGCTGTVLQEGGLADTMNGGDESKQHGEPIEHTTNPYFNAYADFLYLHKLTAGV